VINVPATTANLGPGFDSFGFALDVWNRVSVQKSDRFEMVIEGEGKDRISLTEDNLVVQCVRKVRPPSSLPVAKNTSAGHADPRAALV
jgi:homoserine kinase